MPYVTLLASLLLGLAAPPASPLASASCFLGEWQVDEAYTFSGDNLDAFGGGAMPIRLDGADGYAAAVFEPNGDFTYAFVNWSVTFRPRGEDLPPMTTRVYFDGYAWGRYERAADGVLAVHLGAGRRNPEPAVTSSVTVTMPGFEDTSDMDLASLLGPQTFTLTYRCEGDYLYTDGESAGGAFRNARYTRAE